MAKTSFLDKIMGRDNEDEMPQSLTFERRSPALSAASSGSKVEGGVKAPAPALETTTELAGVMGNLPKVASAKLNELNRVRADLTQMEQELSKSHRMFSLATDRISEIGSFLSHSEINLAALERLEPENMRLNATVSELTREMAREKALASEVEARIIVVEAKYAEAQKVNETHRQDALSQTEALRGLRQDNNSKTREAQTLTGSIEDLKNKLDMERDNAAVTAEKNARIIGEMSTMSRKNLELSKRVDEVHASNKRNASGRESAQNELKSLRLEYAALRDTNIEKASRLEALTHELSVKARSFDENIKYRENEVFGLQSTLEDLKVQLRIKEEVSRRADRELIDLKSMMSEESKRRRRLEKDADEQHSELTQNRDALLMARKNFDDLNRRLIDAQSELRAVKVVNQQQATKLEQYSAVGGVVVDFQEERNRKADAAKTG